MKINKNNSVDPLEIEDLREAIGWDRSENTYDKILPELFSYYTCRKENYLIGYLSVLSDGISDAFLIDLMVHPKHQNLNVGFQIIKKAIYDLKNEGIRCIQVTFNPELEDFYKKCGFHIFKAGIIDFKNMDISI